MSQEIISEIFEYKAMFTKNIVQKCKSWNDGRVTYFRLNRKVQVHTEDGHLITEKFLDKATVRLLEDDERYGEHFKVGSVLVYVEELTATGHRDMARIFKKQRLEPVSSNATTAPPMRQRSPVPVIQRKTVVPLKFSSTPLTLSGTIRRRKVGLSRLETPSKRARPLQQESDDSLSPPEESPSSQDRHQKNHVATRREIRQTGATATTSSSTTRTTTHPSPSMLQPATPALVKRSSVSGPMSRLTPSKYTPVPLTVRPRPEVQEPTIAERSISSSPREPSPSSQQNKRGEQLISIKTIDLPTIQLTCPSPKNLFPKTYTPGSVIRKALETATPFRATLLPFPKRQVTPIPARQTHIKDQTSSSLLQKLLEDDEEPLTSISKPFNTPAPRKVNITPNAVKTEPSLVKEQEIPLPQDSISWGTQDNTTTLAVRLNTLHQQSLRSPIPPPPPSMSRPTIQTSRTPRPRIGHRTREVIRVEQPTPQRTPQTLNNRTPLQKLQQNTTMRVAHTPGVSLNSKKLQNLRMTGHGLVTPASVKSKIDVYQSDSDDEILETQIPKVESQGKITQTETYNYGGEGQRISNLRM